MPTRDERHVLEIEKAVNRALSEAVSALDTLATARDGSGFNEELHSGTYNSSDEYVRYEVAGDICELYPVGP